MLKFAVAPGHHVLGHGANIRMNRITVIYLENDMPLNIV